MKTIKGYNQQQHMPTLILKWHLTAKNGTVGWPMAFSFGLYKKEIDVVIKGNSLPFCAKPKELFQLSFNAYSKCVFNHKRHYFMIFF